MINSLAIVSGGMDSVTLLHYLVKTLGRNPAVVTFIYGQKHSREVDCARYHASLLGCTQHSIIDLSHLAPAFASSALVSGDIEIPAMAAVEGDPQPLTYVPNRNMIFLAIAAAFAESLGATDIYYGAQRHDLYGYWDTTPQFVERINALFRLNRKTTIEVETPFVDYSKADILRIGFDLAVDYDKTWSCYQGNDKACGVCPTCVERLQAFQTVGTLDPLPYLAANS